MSALSDVSTGEDDVFLSSSAEKRGEECIIKDWEVRYLKVNGSLQKGLS